jgi:apolipoprotein N-acyltransferase
MKRELAFPFVLIAVGTIGLAIYNKMIPSFHWTIALFFFALSALVMVTEGLSKTGLNLGASLAGIGIAWVSYFEFGSPFMLVVSLYFFLLGVVLAFVAVSPLQSNGISNSSSNNGNANRQTGQKPGTIAPVAAAQQAAGQASYGVNTPVNADART